ncbi:threonine synthase [Pseudaquidulcibacter saccharophilus]|uniref:threonine synthase n=1 Tax=Pseudaquidulcibacter saccharophilus TaxID=2831900 RepID=UPI001EFF4A7D|nr:threonine synthase [Pseudaquidulcibacter saccharophilus]
MQYISTRGNSPEVGFNQAIIEGLAPDGGLYVPKTWPKLEKSVLENAKTAPYYETAAHVLHAFAGNDIDFETALTLCKQAYGEQWHDKDVVPLKQIAPNLHLLELFHGPSLAFKDVAMQMIGALFEYILAKNNTTLSVVCATSGDTGGAAVEAFKNKKGIETFILMPDGRVSEVQKRFMTASGADNIHALILDGDFDRAQAILKGFFGDKTFVEEVKLAPVNSVNFARIIAQSVYFVIAASKAGIDQPADFIVPTGNFGDAFSGFAAKMLGANIGNIVVANNANNALAASLESGVFAVTGESKATISPAMDIQVPSNFERILFELGGHNAQEIVGYYNSLKANKTFVIKPETLKNIREIFVPSTIDDEGTRQSIKACFAETKEVICPHTAVGYASRVKSPVNGAQKIILATAHPAKFPETIVEVLGINPDLPPHAKDLFERKEKFEKLKSDELEIKNYIKNNY